MDRTRQSISEWSSIVGLVLAVGVLFMKDRAQVWLAFAVVLLLALGLGARVWIEFRRLLKAKYPRGYTVLASTTVYSTTDARTIRYEVYKTLQCKQPVLATVDHEFKWSGSKPPVVTSAHQDVGAVRRNPAHEYDCVPVSFRRALRYNEVEVLHLDMTLDDADQVSSTHLETKVEEPIQFVQLRVLLHYKPSSYAGAARLSRRKINGSLRVEEDLKTIAFDNLTKSFEYHIHKPEPGWFYRLQWDR